MWCHSLPVGMTFCFSDSSRIFPDLPLWCHVSPLRVSSLSAPGPLLRTGPPDPSLCPQLPLAVGECEPVSCFSAEKSCLGQSLLWIFAFRTPFLLRSPLRLYISPLPLCVRGFPGVRKLFLQGSLGSSASIHKMFCGNCSTC